MKRLVLIALIAIAALSTVMAQRPQNPVQFRNYSEMTSYSLKLDSVIGSDDFDRTRWKNVYSYSMDEGFPIRTEIHYVWENQAWELKEKSETGTFEEEALVEIHFFRWTGEDWVMYLRTMCQYDFENPQLLKYVSSFPVNDTLGTQSTRSTYTYDSQNHLTLVMNYIGADSGWVENSKYEYIYNAYGLLDTCLYSTIRNGSWRESEREIYSYDEAQQCISYLVQRKGGWGPFGNNWMDSYRYEFVYEDGELVSELYYAGGGWFGGDLSLDSKVEYTFDANGNLLQKTASIYNEQDWIVRDVYENTFDLLVDANTILGLQEVWESTLSDGLGYALKNEMPLMNQWNTCTISSMYLDTQFSLYYSGFEAVDETETPKLTVYGGEGSLKVDSPEPCAIKVFDLLGRVVASQQHTTHAEFQLRPGVYVVGNGTSMTKAIVR